MKVKKGDILQLDKVFESLGHDKHPVKFSYFIAKNKNIIKKEVEILKQLQIPSSGYNSFEKARVMLAQDLAEKEPDTGMPVIINNMYVMGQNKKKFDKELWTLKDEFKTYIDGFEKQIDDYKEILLEDFDFNGSYKIAIDDLPEQIEPQLIELFINTGLLEE